MIVLEFGEDTDDDTWATVFGGLIGYVIAVNDVDMVLSSLWRDDGYGLYGYAWDDETGQEDSDLPVGFGWEAITKVHIY